MAPTESFDPRTWKDGESAATITPVTAVKLPVAAPVVQAAARGKFRWWLGPVLSAAVLAAGALTAYETRGEAPRVSGPVSAN